MVRLSSPTSSTTSPSSRSTAGRRGWLCRTFISGRARSGSGAFGSWSETNLASGSRSATTSTATPGRKSVIAETDRGPASSRVAGWAADRHPARNRANEELDVRAPKMDGPPAGAALRRPSHGAGRLPDAAQLLHRLRARAGWRAPADGRTDPGWGSLAVPARRFDAGGPARGARADRRIFRLGREPGRPAVAGRRWFGRRAADGHAAASCGPTFDGAGTDSVQQPHRRGCHLSRRTRRNGRRRPRIRGALYVHSPAARGLDRVSPPDRRRNAGGGDQALRQRRPRLRVRTDVAGRVGRQCIGSDGAADRPDSHGTFWPDWSLRRTNDG